MKSKYEQIMQKLKAKDNSYCENCGFLETLARTLKNEDDKVRQRMVKLVALGSFCVFSSILGFYFTLRMGRLLPTNIYYQVKNDKFQIK
jgi:hypothetical protein